MKLRVMAIAASAVLMATGAVGVAQAAGGHGHGGPRVSIGVGIGTGGFFDPYPFDPYPYYTPYEAYGYVPSGPPPVPCTQAEIDKVPTNKIDDPSYAYDRIDASRCAAQVAAAAQAATQTRAPAGPPPAYYFCQSSNAYYPQAKGCAEGWQQVAPKPPGT